MANNETEFTKKLKRICTNRAVVVTTVTLLMALGIILAVTLSANRAKTPMGSDATTAGATEGGADPVIRDEETLPTFNSPETLPAGSEAAEAPLALPVSGSLYKGHDADIQVYSNTMGDYRIHLGVDLATAPEAPVFAAADGKVEQIWEDPLMGWCLALSHAEDTVTVYKNLSETMAEGVAVGVTVKKGQQLSTVGDTATLEMADEPHLHFEVTVAGLAVDPLDYFSEEDVGTLSKDTAYESGAATETATPAPETLPAAK